MRKTLFICMGGIALLLLTCCKKKEAFTPKLDEEQFVKLIIDIHLADGTLSAQNIFRSGKNYKPSYYYNYIYQKHKITREQFDSCILFYSQDAEKFEKMYEEVIDSLNRLETKYKIQLKKENLSQDTINLWKEKTAWKISGQETQEFDFSIPVKEKGVYTIKASIKIFKDDQTITPQIEAYFWKNDTTDGPQTTCFDSVLIAKTPEFKDYMLQLEYPDTTYSELRGNLFAGDNESTRFTRHFEIKGVMIFNPRIKLDTIDTGEADDKTPYPIQ